MFGFPVPRFMPCPECGASVAVDAVGPHECDQERRLNYELVQVERFDRFEADLSQWLSTPAGRFAAFWAERDRRPPAP